MGLACIHSGMEDTSNSRDLRRRAPFVACTPWLGLSKKGWSLLGSCHLDGDSPLSNLSTPYPSNCFYSHLNLT